MLYHRALDSAPMVTRSNRLVSENEYVRVYMDRIRWKHNGKYGTHLRVEQPGRNGVVVVARNARRQFYVVTAFGYSANKHITGFIRGFSDPGESPVEAAEREFREEAALVDPIINIACELGTFSPNPTLLADCAAVVYMDVDGGVQTEHPIAVVEGVVSGKWVGRKELLRMMRCGTFCDGFSLAAWGMCVASGQ